MFKNTNTEAIEALEKIDALIEKLGFHVSYYSTFVRGQQVSFYDSLGNIQSQPVPYKRWANLYERVMALEDLLKVQWIDKKAVGHYEKITKQKNG